MLKKFIPEFFYPQTDRERFYVAMLALMTCVVFVVLLIAIRCESGVVLTSDKTTTKEQTTTRTETKSRPHETAASTVELEFVEREIVEGKESTAKKYPPSEGDKGGGLLAGDIKESTPSDSVRHPSRGELKKYPPSEGDKGGGLTVEYSISEYTDIAARDTVVFRTGDTLRVHFCTELANRKGKFQYEFMPRPDSIRIIERTITSVQEKVMQKQPTFWENIQTAGGYVAAAGVGYIIGRILIK